MKNPDIPYPLLAKYFARQCSPEEKLDVQKWRSANNEQEQLFLKLQEQWLSVHRNQSEDVIPDKQLIWEGVCQRINRKNRPSFASMRSYLLRTAGVAAAIAFIIGFSVSLFFRNTSSGLGSEQFKNTMMTPPGQKSQLILPDGSMVWLNSGSTLTYNYEYNTRERTVELVGEGYFEVKPNQQLPFIVKTGGVDVRVHGTDFNVQAYPEDETIAVSLVRGRVSLVNAQDDRLLTFLEPDQSAIVTKSDLLCRVIACDAEVESVWRLNRLNFKGVKGEEVWKKLERWYGVKLNVSNINPENTYWFSLKTESLIEILEIINRVTPIDYQINGEEVNIRYK